MLYLLYGQDDVTLRETLASMKSEVGPAELRDVNITVMSAPDLTFGQLTSICSTVPFMADKRMLIVEGLGFAQNDCDHGGPTPTELTVTLGHAVTSVRADVRWVGPSQTFHLIVSIKPDDGWHVYWKNPGA